MGYKRNKTYTLTFEAEDLAGLEIKARGASVGVMMYAAALAEVLDNLDAAPNAEERRKIEELIRVFAGCPDGCDWDHSDALGEAGQHFTSRIKEWNFEDEDGAPLSPTYRNFASQDMDLTMPVIMAWINGVSGSGSAPLDETANAGGPSGVESIPMAELSGGQSF
jgi:hypothetical protein